MSQLDIQHPVRKVLWLSPFFVKQELLVWLLSQDAIFNTVFIVSQLNLFNAIKL
jgi:hypothetical protein